MYVCVCLCVCVFIYICTFVPTFDNLSEKDVIGDSENVFDMIFIWAHATRYYSSGVHYCGPG